jgi:hypothetical protein
MNKKISAALLSGAIFSAQAAQSDFGPLHITSDDSWINSLQLTNSPPYNWQTVIAVGVPNVLSTDIVKCHAITEVTDDLGYNVQVDRTIARGTTGGTYPGAYPTLPAFGVITAENVDPNMHHMTVETESVDYGVSGNMVYSLVMSAASTAAGTSSYLTVEKGYSRLWCEVEHTV